MPSKENPRSEQPENVSPLPSPGGMERLQQTSGRLGRWVEGWYPILGATILALIAYKCDLNQKQCEQLIIITLPVGISVAAILAGFQATAQSLMLAIQNSTAIEFLRNSGHYERLISFHWWAIVSLLVFIVVALAFLVIKAVVDDLTFIARPFPVSMGFVSAWAALANFRFLKLMVKLLKLRNMA